MAKLRYRHRYRVPCGYFINGVATFVARFMRIVFLSLGVPYPLHSGGILRAHHLLSALTGRHRVMYASICGERETAEGWPLADELDGPPLLVHRDEAASDGAAPRRRARGTPKLVGQLDRPEFWGVLDRLAAFEPDLVHVQALAMVPYALALKARDPRVKLSLNAENIESVLKLRTTQGEAMRWLSRWRLESYAEVAKLWMYERSVFPRFDRIAVCSEADRKLAARLSGRPDRVRIIPNGVDVAAHANEPVEDGPPRLLFTGAMDYAPNEQAVSYFSEQIFPAIRSRVPDAEFWVVGRRPTETVQRCGERDGVRVVGGVPDIRPYLRESSLFVAPLRAGGGTRLKILEALAARQAVVSTTVGAEGLDLADGRDLVLADEPGAFAERCVELLGDADRRRRLGASGRAAVEAQYDWAGIRHAFADYIDGLAV